MKLETHLVFAECCWFATTSFVDLGHDTSAVLIVAASSVLPDADHPKSWVGRQLGSVSGWLNRIFGHRAFLHSLVALSLVTAIFGVPLSWVAGSVAPAAAICVGYGSHLLADMMTRSGVRLFWPSTLFAVFPGRRRYRVLTGSNSERVFVGAMVLLSLALFPVSRVGFDGLIYRMGGSDELYGEVSRVTGGDTITVKIVGGSIPVKLIGVEAPETEVPERSTGCYGSPASEYTTEALAERVVRLQMPRVGDREDAFGNTLAYVYLDTDEDGDFDHLFNEDLLELDLARTSSYPHAYRRRFERIRERAEGWGAGLSDECPGVAN